MLKEENSPGLGHLMGQIQFLNRVSLSKFQNWSLTGFITVKIPGQNPGKSLKKSQEKSQKESQHETPDIKFAL